MNSVTKERPVTNQAERELDSIDVDGIDYNELDQRRIEQYRRLHSDTVGGSDIVHIQLAVPSDGVGECPQCVFDLPLCGPPGLLEILVDRMRGLVQAEALGEFPNVLNYIVANSPTATRCRRANTPRVETAPPAMNAAVPETGDHKIEEKEEDDPRNLLPVAKAVRKDFSPLLPARQIWAHVGEEFAGCTEGPPLVNENIHLVDTDTAQMCREILMVIHKFAGRQSRKVGAA